MTSQACIERPATIPELLSLEKKSKWEHPAVEKKKFSVRFSQGAGKSNASGERSADSI
jgi:hypothetical protein